MKMYIAAGHPFGAAEDICNGLLDSIFATAFGLDIQDSVNNSELRNVTNTKNQNPPDSVDEPVEFAHAPLPAQFHAILTLTESLETTIKSPLPLLHHWVLRKFPY